jgi:hypothetical protein
VLLTLLAQARAETLKHADTSAGHTSCDSNPPWEHPPLARVLARRVD